MGRYATRSVFAAALCTGVAMVGTAVYGMVGVDAELQRSAFAYQQRTVERVVHERPPERESWRVRYEQDCRGPAPARHPDHLS